MYFCISLARTPCIQDGLVYELKKNVEGTIRRTSFRGLSIDGGLHTCYKVLRRMHGSRNEVHINSGRRNLKLLTAKHYSKTLQLSFVERKYDRNGRWHLYWGGDLLTCSCTKKDDTAFGSDTFLALIATATQSVKWRPCRMVDHESRSQFPTRDEGPVAPLKCPQSPLSQ